MVTDTCPLSPFFFLAGLAAACLPRRRQSADGRARTQLPSKLDRPRPAPNSGPRAGRVTRHHLAIRHVTWPCPCPTRRVGPTVATGHQRQARRRRFSPTSGERLKKKGERKSTCRARTGCSHWRSCLYQRRVRRASSSPLTLHSSLT